MNIDILTFWNMIETAHHTIYLKISQLHKNMQIKQVSLSKYLQ